MELAEKILASLKTQLDNAVEEEAQAKDQFDAADKAWEAARKLAADCENDEYDDLSVKAAFLKGTAIACKKHYEYRHGARRALESAVKWAQYEIELAKKLEDVEFARDFPVCEREEPMAVLF